MRLVIVLVALMCLGCSGGVSGEAKPVEDTAGYLSAIRSSFKSADDKTLLAAGHATCDQLRSGKTRDDLIFEKISRGIDGTNALVLVQIPVRYLCPEYKDK